MEKGLLEKTGKPIEYWIKIVKSTGLEKHGQIMNHLKTEHGLTHGFANFVAHKANKSDAGSMEEEQLVIDQYAKGKEHLKPIYELLIEKIKAFGTDVEFAPKKTSVSCRRKKQFALIQPSTKTRIDLGLKFKDKPHEGRLETSGPFGSMCSHRVQLTEINQVDDELIDWIQEAYEGAG